MCSPYRGESSRRSTTVSYADADRSARKASTSSGVGGKPVRSRVTRRISAVLLASGSGSSPSSSSRSRMNRSISLTGQAASLTAGSAGFCGRLERPVPGPGGPLLDPAPQARRSARASADLPLFLGGICWSGSWLSIRAISSLSSGLPGTIARAPLSVSAKAPSWVSSRSPALRALSSGPWQAKQLSERIGRTSRAKPTGFGLGSPGEPFESPASPRAAHAHAPPRIKHDHRDSST